MSPLRHAALLALSLCACHGDDKEPQESATPQESAEPDLDPATVPLAGSCPMETDQGGFVVSASEDSTDVSGSVADGVVPASVLEQLGAEGDCVILRRNNPFCDPSCDAGEVCDFEGECLPYPSNQDLGVVTLSGLVQDSVMEPVFPGNTYYDTTLPFPAMSGGELIHLSMPEGVYGPLDLYGVGVEAVDVSDAQWNVEDAVDLPITWPAPTISVVRSEIVVEIMIHQHGVTPSTLRCTFDDDGEGTVPGTMISALLDEGVSGFPMGTLERRTADSGAAGSGCMDLIVGAPRSVNVDVIGYTPCLSDAECPEGLECNEEMQICE